MDPNNTHEVIFWDNLYKLRPWLVTYSENRENLNGDLPHIAPKNDKLP